MTRISLLPLAVFAREALLLDDVPPAAVAGCTRLQCEGYAGRFAAGAANALHGVMHGQQCT